MLILGGCTTVSTTQYRVDEEQKIRETAILEELSLRATNRLVFITFENSDGRRIDPSDDVISRIRAAGIPARKASESARDEHTNVIDKASGKPGYIYYAGVLKWLSNSKVEVYTGRTCSSLCGSFTEFIMEKRGGKWIMTIIKRMVTI